jgi:ATP-dependent Clp protease ATP-binding subunit ClpA
MHVDELDIPAGKLTRSAQRVVDRAVEESRRRAHPMITSAHLFHAFAQVEWDLFAQAMRDADVNPQHVIRSVDAHLCRIASSTDADMRVSPTTKLVCRLALHHAGQAGRPGVEPIDLLLALFVETRGIPASILRQHARRRGISSDGESVERCFSSLI